MTFQDERLTNRSPNPKVQAHFVVEAGGDFACEGFPKRPIQGGVTGFPNPAIPGNF
jgi:hypothetical protein